MSTFFQGIDPNFTLMQMDPVFWVVTSLLPILWSFWVSTLGLSWVLVLSRLKTCAGRTFARDLFFDTEIVSLTPFPYFSLSYFVWLIALSKGCTIFLVIPGNFNMNIYTYTHIHIYSFVSHCSCRPVADNKGLKECYYFLLVLCLEYL